jgi:hypothetical protein
LTTPIQSSRLPDVDHYSFTDDGPWVVDPDAMSWRKNLDELRAKTQIEA